MTARMLIRSLCATGLCASGSLAARAACAVVDSPCYPWRIDEKASESVIMENIPNNAVTDSIYRVCICPPGDGVSIVFDFSDNRTALGTVTGASQSAVCRDFHIQTARKSRLLVRRLDGSSGAVEGCYTAF